MDVRRADFAGTWYPGRRSDCVAAIESFLKEIGSCPTGGVPVGGIVPHAGWFYSGKIACRVIRCLERETAPETCIIFGRHLHPGSENYIMKQGAWSTPLGEVEIDSDVAEALAMEFRFRVETPARYDQDNTIELQLPFLKYFFPGTKIVPLGLPPTKGSLEIARRAVEIAEKKGRSPSVLGSTDLTHYGANYGFLPQGSGREALSWVKTVNDKRMVDLMLGMDAEGLIAESLNRFNACCGGAAAAAIAACRALGATRAEQLDYYTSYDIRPDASFVGYAGVVFMASA